MASAAGRRRKGVTGEAEVAAKWAAGGATVRALEGLGDHLVICANGVTIHNETKRHERVRLPEWLAQAEREAPQGTVPVVTFRQSHGRWYATLALDDLVAIVGRT